MKLGSKFFLFILLLNFSCFSFAEEKITSTPLINVEQINPSFEDLDDVNENVTTSQNLKKKKKIQI